MIRSDIILIGPVGVGKSTLAELLSDKLKMPRASLDDRRWAMYEAMGYDFEKADKLMKEEGFLGLYRYWKPFEVASVEEVLKLFPNHIHDFGAGQSVYEDPNLFSRVEKLLQPFGHVILLLPTPDKDQSLAILRERNGFEHNDLFVHTACNEKLAKYVVYTQGKTPMETCDEIIHLIGADL